MSLSKVTKGHLLDIGVSLKQTLTQQPFEAKMTKGSLTQIHHDNLSKIEGYDYRKLLSTLDMLYRQVNNMVRSAVCYCLHFLILTAARPRPKNDQE